MKSTIRLFKAVPIKERKLGLGKVDSEILEKTLKNGFIFSDEVIADKSKGELLDLIKSVEEELGINGEKMNASFHKSWKKVRDSSIEQLVIEQIIHYFTTYGFEKLGIYDKDSVYIPDEALDIPELELDKIRLIVIKGYTKEQLKEKLITLLGSGIALKDQTIKDVVDVSLFVGLSVEEIEAINNKEVRVIMYESLNIVPQNPIEFLRYLVYKATDSTLLIKNSKTVAAIKEKKNLNVAVLLSDYETKYGLDALAGIFYRFKPLFLAFRTNSNTKNIVNRIRRLAIKKHCPMKEDYLNSVTAKISMGKKLDLNQLAEELSKVNIFRRIRLAYALKYRTSDPEAILYRVRNGKGYSKEFEFDNIKEAKEALDVVLGSIAYVVKDKVKGKKIFLPDNFSYALPATEKQFVGYLPSGSYVTVEKDLVFGVHWENVKNHRIDLDLSVVSASGKYGWDSYYRSSSRNILFSGDITDAPKPRGASELFYVQKQTKDAYILMINYFNYNAGVPVPFKFIVASQPTSSMERNYVVDPNNIIVSIASEISDKQKIGGLILTDEDKCRFYFTEVSVGNNITSSNNKHTEYSRKYLRTFYENMITLNEILKLSGTEFVKNKEEADLDLSPESLEKDTIITLLS